MKLCNPFILTVLFLAVVAVGCKNYKKNEVQPTRNDSLINNTASVADSAHLRGARLLAANDCITCHSIDKKLVGPSFIQIAAKYKNDEGLAEYLSGNVIKGSKGLYGNNAMTPHPNINHNDLIAMLKYILSLKPTGK